MKKILIFSLAYYPKYVGGAEVALKEITDRIHESEMQFDMITLRFDSGLPKEERVGNVSVYRIGFTGKNAAIGDLVRFPLVLNKYLFPFLAAWKAVQLQRSEKYDAIWAMMANYAGFGALFFKLLNPKIPYLLTLQEGDSPEYIKKRVGLLGGLHALVFRKADLIQAISRFLETWARNMGYRGELIVVPNAVDVAHFSQTYDEGDLEQLAASLGKKNNERYIITTSRLVSKNGVDQVILALKHLPNDVTFLILGIGPDEPALKKLAASSGVGERVRFLGQIGHADLPRYLKIAEVFVRPSRSEGMGNSFIEAMAADVPVVATPVGGIVDFLFDPERDPGKEPTGLFARVDDPADLACQIKRLLDDKELRERIVANAHKMVAEKYDWELIAGDMKKKVFDRLVV